MMMYLPLRRDNGINSLFVDKLNFELLWRLSFFTNGAPKFIDFVKDVGGGADALEFCCLKLLSIPFCNERETYF